MGKILTKRNITSFAVIIFLLLVIPGSVYLVRERQIYQKKAAGPQLLDNLNIDLNQGGAITYVGLDGENVVDTNDCGRLIQLALYDEDLPRVTAGPVCLPSNPGFNVAWNPVQACDACLNTAFSPVLSGSDKSFVRVRPLLWIGNGQAGDFIIEQRISQTLYSNAVKVNWKIIHDGSDYHKRFSIELPATWINNKYSKFVYYNGNNPWTNDGLSETVSDYAYTPDKWLGTESWGALVNPANNRGIGVYNPASVLSMNFSSNPANGSNLPRYFTTWISMEFSPKSEYSFDVYILTGSKEEIRGTVYKLPRNNNYLVEPIGNIPLTANKGETINIPVKITNKTLVPFHKNDNKPNYDKTMIKVKNNSGIEDWIAITSDVMPGQSITMNLPVRMPTVIGQSRYFFDVLNRWWLIQSGFPMYSFVVDVGSSVLPEPANSVSVGTVEPIRTGTTITGYKATVTLSGNPAPLKTFGGETAGCAVKLIGASGETPGDSAEAIKNSLASAGAYCLGEGVTTYDFVFSPDESAHSRKIFASFHNDSVNMASNHWSNQAWSIPVSSAAVNVPAVGEPANTISVGAVTQFVDNGITKYKVHVTLTANPAPLLSFGGKTETKTVKVIAAAAADPSANPPVVADGETAIRNGLAQNTGGIYLRQNLDSFDLVFTPEEYGKKRVLWATFHNDSANMASNYWPNLAWSIPQSSAEFNVPLLPTPPLTTPLCPWDIVKTGASNGKVDNDDLTKLNSCYDPFGFPSAYCQVADLNSNGVVNALDYSLLLTHWGNCP